MSRRHFAIVFACALALALGSAAAAAQDADARRAQVRAAIEAAERGQDDPGRNAQLETHPLYPWVEYARLQRRIATVSRSQAQDFLRRHQGQAVADAFRSLWLAALARRQDWPAFLAAWAPTGDVALRCAHLNARQATGRADAEWIREAQAVWRSSGKSLPDACDPVFAVLDARRGLDAALRWERIELAAAEQQPGVMRSAARGLPAAERALAEDYAAFQQAVHTRALDWPRTERSRRMAMHGLARLGKADPAAAELQLPRYAQALGMTEAERGPVLYQIALWTVASYEPDSARRLDAVPESAYDERLHEWRLREALARGDWRAALAAVRKMPAAMREDARWRYLEARLAEKTGAAAEAQALYRQAARSATFHGFLAADRLEQPYALCPLRVDAGQADAPERQAVAGDPALVRALELFKIERTGWAVREWNSALARFDDRQRRLAVAVAGEHGWYDRAVFSLGRQPEEQRFYELRFPLHHGEAIRRESARHGLDPAWVAAEIRAESAFNPRARSPANARGLMQVLPATAAGVARRLGIRWGGAESLYDPETNLRYGTSYLREMEDKYGLPYVAIAAYNAGPAPTARWQSQRPNFDPDIWIETISYRETREYVARILAFSVIYDWRLNGDALPVTDRMLGRLQGQRKKFVCPEAE